MDFPKAAPPRFIRDECIDAVKGHYHRIEASVGEKCEVRGIGHQEFQLRKLFSTRRHHVWRVVHTDVTRCQAREMRSRAAAPDAQIQNRLAWLQKFLKQSLLARTEVVEQSVIGCHFGLVIDGKIRVPLY